MLFVNTCTGSTTFRETPLLPYAHSRIGRLITRFSCLYRTKYTPELSLCQVFILSHQLLIGTKIYFSIEKHFAGIASPLSQEVSWEMRVEGCTNDLPGFNDTVEWDLGNPGTLLRAC